MTSSHSDRPWNYRPLCGLQHETCPTALAATAATASAASVQPPAATPLPLLRIAMLQLEPKETEVAMANHAEAMIRAAAAKGAAIVILPEMYHVGYCTICTVVCSHLTTRYHPYLVLTLIICFSLFQPQCLGEDPHRTLPPPPLARLLSFVYLLTCARAHLQAICARSILDGGKTIFAACTIGQHEHSVQPQRKVLT